MPRDYATVTCAHNEREYIARCLQSILAQTCKPAKTIVVLDRCVDGSANEIAGQVDLIIRKDKVGSWHNSMSENLEIARNSVTSEFYAIVDADVILSPNYFEILFREMSDATIVSGEIVTASPNLLGRLVKIWERTFKFAPVGRFPRGCALMISKEFLDEISGFPDLVSFETRILEQAQNRGRRVLIVPEARAYHTRKLALRQIVARQIRSGQARRELHWPIWRTILHALFRLRPFVLWGYLRG